MVQEKVLPTININIFLCGSVVEKVDAFKFRDINQQKIFRGQIIHPGLEYGARLHNGF